MNTLKTSDYVYDLPPEKIASYPLEQRDQSKLLVYKEREIFHSNFISLPEFLPADAFLFFNNTRVIPARLLFKKESGALIEIFLLDPIQPSPLLTETMVASGRATWHCTIGNLKKWTDGIHLKKETPEGVLRAELKDRVRGWVDFTWDGDATFAAMIEGAGETPLPPYIKRKPEAGDQAWYQTIYSRAEGAVAAPTAGLHFTNEVFHKLKERDIKHDFLTLHVSAGTFLPIKSENPDEHVMHKEQVVVTRTNIEHLLMEERTVTAVGTTSMRTLESIYWYGAMLVRDPAAEFRIRQGDPYIYDNPPPARRAIEAVAKYMDDKGLDRLVGETSILIRPGYQFKVCRALITNFHQPGSTLILLIAAFVGPAWRRLYEAALASDYRFLSYGDSSLLIPAPDKHF